VRDNACRTTNLPWQLDGGALAMELGLPAVRLINDLEAAGWGVEQVTPEHRELLHPGDPVPRGNQAIIAAGTGLGEAGRVWCGDGYRPFATEGSHADFAPGDPTEIARMAWLGGWFGHVSWERLVSGQGLVNIYRFLREQGGAACHPDPLGAEDAAAAIAVRAGDDGLCGEALDRFVRLFGAEAGNLALKLMATGGLFVAGGIAPKIAERLRQGGFVEAFLAKGRMRPLLEAMPVTLLSDPHLALKGAAVYGSRHL
jgi:glucokinase